MFTIALPKGRILTEAIPLLKRAGLAPAEGEGALDGRKILLPSQDNNVRLIVVRAADVQTYVSHGTAQLGLVGRELLLENPMEAVVHQSDLGIGKCRLVAATSDGYDYQHKCVSGARVTVATKFPRLSRMFLAEAGLQAEIVKLYGTMELAPNVGLADVIVDLVATGATLHANRLVEAASLMDVSTFLVLNRNYSWHNRQELGALAERMTAAAKQIATTQ